MVFDLAQPLPRILDRMPGPINLRPMHGNSGDAGVRVTKPMVAAFNPDDSEARLPQRGNDLAAGEPRQTAHAGTVTR